MTKTVSPLKILLKISLRPLRPLRLPNQHSKIKINRPILNHSLRHLLLEMTLNMPLFLIESNRMITTLSSQTLLMRIRTHNSQLKLRKSTLEVCMPSLVLNFTINVCSHMAVLVTKKHLSNCLKSKETSKQVPKSSSLSTRASSTTGMDLGT